MLSRVVLVLALWLTLTGAAQAADVHVTRSDDRPTGTCGVDGCTLREALAVAQNGDTVRLGTGVRRLEQGTLEVTRSITIAGLVADVSSIDGSTNQRRILHVHAGATVTLRDLSLQGGTTGFEGPDPLAVDGGGALYNEGSTTVEDVVFDANGFSAAGGAISNRGTLTLTDVDLRGNVGGFGGGLFVHGGTVTVNRSTIRESVGNSGGAAVYVRAGTVELVNASVISNGEFGQGGGIVNAGGPAAATARRPCAAPPGSSRTRARARSRA